MKKHIVGRREWTKPVIQRLGEISDVAGPSGTGTQAGGGGQNRS